MTYTDHKFYAVFNKLSIFFRSIAAIIIFMFLLFTFQMLETATLFNGLLMVKMPEDYLRIGASIIIAMVIEYSQFLFTVNKDSFENHMARTWVPKVIGLISFAINLAFFSVWIGTWDIITIKLILSFTLAFLTYFYTELYISKWDELEQLLGWKKEMEVEEQKLAKWKEDLHSKEALLSELENTLDKEKRSIKRSNLALQEAETNLSDLQTASQHLTHQVEKLQAQESESQVTLSDLSAQQSKLEKTLSGLRAEEKRIQQYIKASTCVCGKICTSPQARAAHERACPIAIEEKKKNPKQKTAA